MVDRSFATASWTSGRPSPEVHDAVRAACRLLYDVEDDFVGRVRVALPHLVPELRRSTPDEVAAIAWALARAVLWAGLTADPPDVVEQALRSVGADQARRGFPAEGYHGAGHALLRAARDTHENSWSSELSSSWVAFYAWLSEHLVAGLPSTPQPVAPPQPMTPQPALQPAPAPGLPPSLGTGGATGRATGAPGTLDDVLELLRLRYFAGNDRALGAILTRIALRTGADLRAPRSDQRANPAVVANVLAVLQVMGYVLSPGNSGAGLEASAPPGQAARTAGPTGRTARWWSRRTASLRGAR